AHQHLIEDKWRRGRRVAAAASREDTDIGFTSAGAIALRKTRWNIHCRVPSREDAVEGRRSLPRHGREVAAGERIGRVEREERRPPDQSVPPRKQMEGR